MRPLVIVRPEPGASATAEAARAQGLEPVVIPFFRVEPLDWTPPRTGDFDSLLLTSANALRHAGPALDQLRALPAYCVGEATASEASNVGLSVAASGTGGVDALLDSVPGDARLLHLCGADWREPAGAAQRIVHLPVYRSVELPRPANIAAIAGAVVAVHSRRAAGALARHADETGLSRETIAVAAISADVREAAGEGWERVEITETASDSGILAIAARLCHNRR